MLNHGIKTTLLFILLHCLGCNLPHNKSSNELINLTKSMIGGREYYKIYNNINDSIKYWSLNKLGYYQYLGKSKKYIVDSLLCFNQEKNRLVTCILQQQLLKEGVQDDIEYLLGESINGRWYFFSGGATLTLPRELYQKDIHSALSLNKLHQIALKEIYSGYLKRNGEINEDWFLSHFEGPGWGDFNNQAAIDWVLNGKRFNNKKDFFEFLHLEVVKNNWNGINKDSIKPLPPNPLP